MSNTSAISIIWHTGKQHWDKERRSHCLRTVGVEPIPTAAVAGDRAVCGPTLELD